MGLGRRNARHVNLAGDKCGYRGVEIISQSDVNVADVLFRAILRRPLCETLQKLLDGHEETSDGRFDGRLDQGESKCWGYRRRELAAAASASMYA
jgi:hypothetical protein